MKIDPIKLKNIAAEARKVSLEMATLATQLEMASEDNMSPGDVSLLGAYAARAFVNDKLPILERL